MAIITHNKKVIRYIVEIIGSTQYNHSMLCYNHVCRTSVFLCSVLLIIWLKFENKAQSAYIHYLQIIFNVMLVKNYF